MAEKLKEYIERYNSGFQKFEKNLNGQSTSKIHQIRKDAFNNFVVRGFPTTKIEEWKYTNVDTIANTNFSFPSDTISLQKTNIENFFIKKLDCYKIVFVNGRFIENLSDNLNSENEFAVTELKEYINAKINSDDQFLTKLANYKDDSFVALNTAFIQNGIVIKIKKEKTINKPFFLLYISTSKNGSVINQPRILFKSEANSSATIIESYQSLNSMNDMNNVVSEFYLEENARLDHIKIQNESSSSFHISNQFASLAKNCNFSTLNINLGGKITRSNIFTKLTGEASECVLNGVYIGNGTQHIDNRTVIDHVKPHCLSSETYKGIVGDNARGIFNGKIQVYQEAQKTNAIQNNSGLLLSENASIDTKPQLEIYADDVKCTHGATIGQLNEEALFYLRSRGIDMQQAKNMLINAFAGEVVDQIENEVLRERIQDYIDEKLKLIA